MRKVPFLITNCHRCKKQIELWEENDFFAEFCKNGIEFFYKCPECGIVEKQPESLLPTYLKEKLVKSAVTICPKCGKHLHLKEETDFHAEFEKEGIKFFYTCPECGTVEERPGQFLPTFLKERLMQDAIKRKTLIEFILTMAGIVVIILLLLLFLLR